MTEARQTDPARSPRGEEGFTIVEVIIAAMIVVISGLAVLGVVDAASRNTFRAQQSQVLNDRLQSEMGKLKQLSYAQLALTSLPSHATDPTNPDYRVSSTSFNVNASGTANYEPLAYNGGTSHDEGATGAVSGGTVDPGPTPFQSGDVKGNVYRYVTWQQDTSCTSCGQPWVKHVTVIATLNTTGVGGTRVYQELQSDIENPSANSNAGGPGGGGTDATPWTFWLTDTSCDNNSRQPITGDHLTHNTRGACSAGPKLGVNSPGAPDLMYTQAPPCLNNDCSTTQPLYDYATDVEPAQNSGNDRGLQLRGGPSCSNVVSGTLGTTFGTLPLVADTVDTTYYQKVHKWLSEPIPSGYNVVFNGTGELDLWTKSINNAVEPGSICAYLFYRHTVLGQTVDTPVVNLDLSNVNYFTYSQNPWPTEWTELHIPLHFNLSVGNALALAPGNQLGLALSVDGNNTGSGGLEFLYDAPTFDSRLQAQVSPGISLPF